MAQKPPHCRDYDTFCSYPAGGTVPDVVTSISTSITRVVRGKGSTKLLAVARKRDGERKQGGGGTSAIEGGSTEVTHFMQS